MVALVADIGGTNSRLALADSDGKLQGVRRFRNRDYSSFGEILADYLAACDSHPERAALAVAGPVHKQEVLLTNLGWRLVAAELERDHGMRSVELVNDFAALAWATLYLDKTSLLQLGGGRSDPQAARVVLGPGTGLGVGGLVPAANAWAAVAGEGGHVTMPPLTGVENELIAAATQAYGHCSAERLLCGSGLQFIYQHLGGTDCPPDEITAAAGAGEQRALDALHLFFDLLATVAGDLALTFGARGGVYLAGGILPRVSELLLASGFRQRFEAKGRMRSYLQPVPVYLMTAADPALSGLAGYLSRA